jgi:hypothetical protein
MAKAKQRKSILGLGLDNQDGHLRITKGENFLLCGGSKETHGEMQEKTIKINEQLKKRGRTLDNVSNREFLDIAQRSGLKPVPGPQPPSAKRSPKTS